MGTRHLQTVITKAGETKIKQYGQWDGYPGGQGVKILRYLKNGDLEKYQENLEKIHEITENEIQKVNESGNNWTTVYPHLSRDCGCKIHQLIENGIVEFVQYCSDENAKEWCEGFYTIDFSKNEFISEFYNHNATFKLDDLPSEQTYISIMNSELEI